MTPNIFNWATSELTQDAFLCWLFNWADNAYRDNKLHQIGCKLIIECFKLHGIHIKKNDISDIEIIKQYKNIDVVIKIGSKYAIIIEDKLQTIQHSNQLKRYLKQLSNEKRILIPIYYKPYNQSDISEVENSGFKHLTRKIILPILKFHNTVNELLLMYIDFIQSIEDETNSYLIRSANDWTDLSWHGFFSHLQEIFDDGAWDYVNNPNGGFFGFWWYWYGNRYCEQYLQLEENKLCFKIKVSNKNHRYSLRNKWCDKIIATSQKFNVSIIKPARFGSGNFMTVAIFENDYRVFNNDKLNLSKTLRNIKIAMKILDELCK